MDEAKKSLAPTLAESEATRQREVSKARYFEMLANRVRRGDLVLEDIEVDVDGSLINVSLKIRDPKTMAAELAMIDRVAAEAAEAEAHGMVDVTASGEGERRYENPLPEPSSSPFAHGQAEGVQGGE